jgi:hypothetical protein
MTTRNDQSYEDTLTNTLSGKWGQEYPTNKPIETIQTPVTRKKRLANGKMIKINGECIKIIGLIIGMLFIGYLSYNIARDQIISNRAYPIQWSEVYDKFMERPNTQGLTSVQKTAVMEKYKQDQAQWGRWWEEGYKGKVVRWTGKVMNVQEADNDGNVKVTVDMGASYLGNDIILFVDPKYKEKAVNLTKKGRVTFRVTLGREPPDRLHPYWFKFENAIIE